MLAAAIVGAGVLIVWRGAERVSGLSVASVRGAVVERGSAAPEVVEALERSVLLVHSVGCGAERQATAVLLDDGRRRFGLTNQHVVAGSHDVLVRDTDDTVAVRGLIEGRDAAELEGDGLEATGAVPLPVGSPPMLGAGVVVAGYPAGAFSAVNGHVRAIERREGYGASADVMIVDVQAVPGISGGVVVDVTGRAVGLVAARDPVTGDVVAYPIGALGPASDGAMVGCT